MLATGLFAVVKSIHFSEGLVEVDANHPLAGEDLYLEIEVAELTKSSALSVATFAGGSFWDLELTFQRVDGVVSTQVWGLKRRRREEGRRGGEKGGGEGRRGGKEGERLRVRSAAVGDR